MRECLRQKDNSEMNSQLRKSFIHASPYISQPLANTSAICMVIKGDDFLEMIP